jgi:myosin-5
LEVERQENKTTKEEIANAQKKINELVHESQQSQETRKQLEDTIKRSDVFSSVCAPTSSSVSSLHCDSDLSL